MITNELKSLIERYCMGKEPTDAQMDEIMDKALQENADFQEVVALIEEMKNKVQAVVTYTLTLTEVTNPMMAMLTARAVLGWDSAQSRENFAKLPIVVKTTTNQDEASEIYEKLSRGGMVIEPNAVEGVAESSAGDMRTAINSSPYSKLPMDKIRAAARANYPNRKIKALAVATLKISETIQERDPDAEDPDYPTLDEAEVAYMVHPSEFDSSVSKYASPIHFLFMKDGVPIVAVVAVTSGGFLTNNVLYTADACRKNNIGYMRVYATGAYADWIDGGYSEISDEPVTEKTIRFCKDWLVGKINDYLNDREKAEAETQAARDRASERGWGRWMRRRSWDQIVSDHSSFYDDDDDDE